MSTDSESDIKIVTTNSATTPVVLEDKLGAFRQPMVTTTGIIIGFVLNFASTLVRDETPINEWLAWMVAVSVFIGVTCLILVLYRSLRMDYPRENAENYYNRTLQFLVVGIAGSFLGAFIQVYFKFLIVQKKGSAE